MVNNLNYLVISDIHIGHPRVPSKNIVDNFNTFILTYHKHLKELDVFFILGDITDKPLMSGTHDHDMLTMWFIRLIAYAKKNNIEIVVIRGTISHDGKGLESFANMITSISDVKYTYIDTISVITRNGMNVLIIPDNTHKEGKEVEEEVYKKFISKGVVLDIAMVHRAFNFQLPITLDESLNESFWLDNIKHYIHVGHIHTPMTYGRIIGEGSFDRLTHGQEEIKGGVMSYVNPKNSRWVFLENKQATIFKRLMFKVVDIPKMVKEIKKYKPGSFLEIVLPANELKHFNKRVLLVLVTEYEISFKKDSEQSEIKLIVSKPLKEYDLTPSSVKKLLLERVEIDYKPNAEKELELAYKTMNVG